jgi:MinD superfamily P-loop ATPase
MGMVHRPDPGKRGDGNGKERSIMKEIVVISGKGGTGKTSLTAAFAALGGSLVLADCDVDAADLHLVLNPEITREDIFIGGSKAAIRKTDCTGCGLCFEHCRFRAIEYPLTADGDRADKPLINPIFCEGCRVCARICPVDAIAFEPAESGRLFVSRTPLGPMVHARLGIAQGNSGKLVTLVRQEARAIAEREACEYIITDGPPGVGCPVIASITGANLALVVTEPTLSGRHDMLRAAELTAHFHIPTLVCVNKWDIHPGMSELIEAEARDHGVIPAGRIRYDRLVTDAQVQRTNVLACGDSPVGEEIKAVWRSIEGALMQGNTFKMYSQ